MLPWPGLARWTPPAVVDAAIAAAAQRAGFAPGDADAAAAIARAGVPLLALHGLRDDILPPAHSERLAAAALDATTHFEPACDHETIFREESVRSILIDWLVAEADTDGCATAPLTTDAAG